MGVARVLGRALAAPPPGASVLALLALIALALAAPSTPAHAREADPAGQVEAAGAAATSPTSSSQTRTVRWYGDREITVPRVVTRVASSWEAQNAVLAMLGFGPSIVASTRFARDMPAFRKLLPGIEKVPLAISAPGLLDVEALIHLRPQVLFMSSSPAPAQAAQLRRAGIAIASFRANSLPALVERVRITGEILGPAAVERARRYEAYFQANVERVRAALADLPPEERVSLYHPLGSPLGTSGRPSLNQDWMDLAGVRNVAEDWFDHDGRTANVSIEQVLAADPDLIVAMRAQDAEVIRTDPKWRKLRAVRSGRVLANPRGMFWWSRETSEVALQFLWLATVAYPQRMKDVDIRAETRHFYRTFYDYELSDAEVDEFLSPGR